MKFFDCQCAFGPYRTRVFRFARTAEELIEELDFSNIERALVYHTTMRFDHPAVGNERVVAEVVGHPRLLPTWSLLPSQTGEQPPVDVLLRQMREQNVRALRIFPDDHRYFCDDITWGDQLAVYMERRIPLFVRASLDKVAQLLRSFPDLIVVTGSQGSKPRRRRDRGVLQAVLGFAARLRLWVSGQLERRGDAGPGAGRNFRRRAAVDRLGQPVPTPG
jgi:hypothetical protein